MFKRSREKFKKERQNNEDIISMLPLINELANGKIAYAEESTLGNAEVAAAWNKMVDGIFVERKKCVLSINELLAYMTDMTYLKDMIGNVRMQNESLHTMAASSEEMSASIDDVANRAQSVVELANDSVNLAQNSNHSMEETFAYIQKSFESVKSVSNDMNNLVGSMKQIEEIIDIIKGVAEQTNLLALNAAIEAARAGEQGKGFAVVAGEVKKLAEHTKNSVGSIQENIGVLRGKLSEVVTHTNETASQLENGNKLVNQVISSNSEIVRSIQKVNEEILQIAANTQEQTAVTEELAQRVGESSQAIGRVLVECDKTGNSIFKLSQMNNETRLKMLGNSSCLSSIDLLEICKTDHLMWRWRVYNMILGYEKIDVDAIGTHNDCRLGKWYYTNGKSVFNEDYTFKSIEQPHVELHQLAKEAAIAYSKQDIAAAEAALEKMNLCSGKIVGAIEELQKKLAQK